jgi:hypothetical protein
MAELEIDFVKLQNDKANDLTDKVMAKIGELFLKREIGPSDSIFGVGTSIEGPRDDIRRVILDWLTEEKIDG